MRSQVQIAEELNVRKESAELLLDREFLKKRPSSQRSNISRKVSTDRCAGGRVPG